MMFLNQTMKRNKALVETAFQLHRSGRILPDSYVIDVDTFLANAGRMLAEANRYDFKLYFMLKQVGRNPYLARELIELGYPGAVVVDFREAQVMMDHGIPIGNVGHLVQIPEQMVKTVVAADPEVVTVYSVEKAKTVDRAAAELGKKQAVMLRVYGEDDMVYSGQTAGICLSELESAVQRIRAECPHVTIGGITSFPCYLYDEALGDIVPTNNLASVLAGRDILNRLGFGDLIIDTPSATCTRTIGRMAAAGSNCGEPGHGFSGTTPMHMYQDMEEVPGVVYVSEISHNFMGDAYCYGGGHYRRSHVTQALTGTDFKSARTVRVIPPSDESIDYHFGITGECPVGDTVIMAFRFQMFVTRSDVVLVRGIRKGQPEIVGIYDSLGGKKDR